MHFPPPCEAGARRYDLLRGRGYENEFAIFFMEKRLDKLDVDVALRFSPTPPCQMGLQLDWLEYIRNSFFIGR